MLRAVLIGLIRFYRKGISPWTPAACRFQPTCSAYALEAVERYGALKGGGLAVRRLLRCHPWGGSGFDPVPATGSPAQRVGGSDGPCTRSTSPAEASDRRMERGWDGRTTSEAEARARPTTDEPRTTKAMPNP